jgi:hypothetical protein
MDSGITSAAGIRRERDRVVIGISTGVKESSNESEKQFSADH